MRKPSVAPAQNNSSGSTLLLLSKVNLSIVETTVEKSGISTSAQSLLAQGGKKRETKKPGSPGLKLHHGHHEDKDKDAWIARFENFIMIIMKTKTKTKKPRSPGLKTSRCFFNSRANVGLNALKSKISAGKKLKNEATVETTAGLGRFDVFFPLWFYLDDQLPSLIIIFTILSGKTQTNKDEIRRRLFFTTRPAELTDEEVDGHQDPGFRGFHGHSLLFLFSRLYSRLHS